MTAVCHVARLRQDRRAPASRSNRAPSFLNLPNELSHLASALCPLPTAQCLHHRVDLLVDAIHAHVVMINTYKRHDYHRWQQSERHASALVGRANHSACHADREEGHPVAVVDSHDLHACFFDDKLVSLIKLVFAANKLLDKRCLFLLLRNAVAPPSAQVVVRVSAAFDFLPGTGV